MQRQALVIQTSSSNLCGDRSVRVQIDLAGSDGFEDMKVDKIDRQKNFSRDILQSTPLSLWAV